MAERKFNRLQSAFDKRHADWLERVEPDIDGALRDELADGATPDEVEQFAKRIGGENQWFAGRVIGAARHIQRQNERRR
jgi:hypothetical protein